MKLLPLLFLLLPLADAPAQSVVRVDSLLPEGVRLDRGWRFHAGDDFRWAAPDFDDRSWPQQKTRFNPTDAPPGWRGIGWFRLCFRLDSLPANRLLALRLEHYGASEVYLDGRKIGGFGVVGRSPGTGVDYASRYDFIPFRLDQPGEHRLALRLSATRPYLLRWAHHPQGFGAVLMTNDRAVAAAVDHTRIWSLNLLSVFVPGWFAVLHLALFLFYPARRSNLYYGICLLLFAGTSACVYLDGTLTNPAVLQGLAYTFWLGNVAFALAFVVFIYSVCYAKPPRLVWGVGALAALVVGLVGFSHVVNAVPYVFGYVGLCFVEITRVVTGAVLRRQPGVWLIGVGLLALVMGLFIGASDVLKIWQGNPWGQNLFLTFSFLTLPLCTSLYLAQDFGRTSRDLAVQLRQVEDLSAQTRAQEAEKLTLIASQNERLERTVRERTEQLQRQAEQLRELDAVKSRFFTNLTHEFRTPLTLMLGPAEQVLAQTGEAKTRQQVGLVRRNAQRLLRLINQLLDLSKLEAGKLELNSAPGELVGLVRGTLHQFESLAAEKGITLRFVAQPERLPVALDRDKLEKILFNLFSNALKFTPGGGTVAVRLTHGEDGWAQLTVEDTGVGIPAEKLPYLYDRFYQVDASDTREGEGTGIGLALTKELVELHGGTIAIRSEVGVGTVVAVRWPVQPVALDENTPEADPSPAPLPTPAPPVPPGVFDSFDDAPLVLLVEDNADVRAFLRSSLGEAYRILEAPNGEEGLRLAQQQVPDLVITDLMMPRMDGYQVCAALKGDERTSHVPVVMLTARADLDSKLHGLETGADAYLAKPFNQRELLAQVGNLIHLRRQLRERYGRNSVWQNPDPALPSMERAFLDRVRAAIETHLADEGFSVERLSDEVGLSRTQLHRKLSALLDQSPGDLIRLLRLRRAHELLAANVGTVAEVAYRVGFGNPANFSTSFSRHFGYAPSEVRRRAVNSS